MENQISVGNKNSQQIGQSPVSQPVQIPEKLRIIYLTIGLVVLICFIIFGLGGYFLGRQSSKNFLDVEQRLIQTTSYPSPNKSINSSVPTKQPSTDIFDLERLVFPSLPAGFSTSKNKDNSTHVVYTITIEHKTDEANEPVVVADISNWHPYELDFNNSNKKQSRFGEVSFLGKKYQLYIKENTIHGDGPALNEGDCSYSAVGDTHYFISEEKIYVSIDETRSSSYCNGKTTEESTQPTEEDVKKAINIIENIKLK